MKHVAIFIIALLTLISCRNKDNSNIKNSDIETISVFECYILIQKEDFSIQLK